MHENQHSAKQRKLTFNLQKVSTIFIHEVVTSSHVLILLSILTDSFVSNPVLSMPLDSLLTMEVLLRDFRRLEKMKLINESCLNNLR